MTAKDIVNNYYSSDAFINPDVLEQYVHDDITLHWHSSKGFLLHSKQDIILLITEMQRSYASARIKIHDIVAENNRVSVRYTHYVNPIESPNEEMVLAQFMSFWEVKDNKLYKGYLMSQLA